MRCKTRLDRRETEIERANNRRNDCSTATTLTSASRRHSFQDLYIYIYIPPAEEVMQRAGKKVSISPETLPAHAHAHACEHAMGLLRSVPDAGRRGLGDSWQVARDMGDMVDRDRDVPSSICLVRRRSF